MSFIVEKNFLAILRRYGHDVYLQRVLNLEEGNENYSYSTKLEKWTTYSVLPGGTSGISNIADQAPEGSVFNVDMIFYLQAEVNPASGDRIYEEMNRYPNHEVIYAIDYAQPMRGLGGKIVFWNVGASRIDPS